MSFTIELGYVTRFFEVLRKHLEENQCTHSIWEIAAEADSNTGKGNSDIQ